MTVWSMLTECVSQLDEPFRRSEIVGWFRRHYPEVNEATLAAHIQAATENATNRARNNPLGSRAPLLRRIDHGLYVRAAAPEPAAGGPAPDAAIPRPRGASEADVILVGCVKTKQPAASPAEELFASPLFAGRRAYAVGSGRPWYILSAKFGLLAPEDVIGPYDVYLADQAVEYRQAWGEFVAAQLERYEGGLSGRVVEVHAGAAYADPLRRPLGARGAKLLTPMAHLSQGQQLAWYKNRASNAPPPVATQPKKRPAITADDLVRVLSDPARALSPAQIRSRGPAGLEAPGLYSWWVDETGATDLARGLGRPLTAGLIYAGQAGATRWPSGRRSGSTLWGRIVGMHLAGAAEFSTFRRTLAAILRPVLALGDEDDPRLSTWISDHLKVIAVPVPDADRLGQIEAAVLAALDPPLNLAGMPASPVRARLSELRRLRGGDSGVERSAPAVLMQPDDRLREDSLDQVERQFHQAMVGIYETAKRELGYNATRFLQMISEHGGLAAAKQLLWDDHLHDGFTTLWSHHRLDLSVEAHVLRPEFASLFTDDDRQQAHDRLALYGWRVES